jgi:hypothetical protein
MQNFGDARSKVDCRQAKNHARYPVRRMVRMFAYSYRSRYRGSSAPFFPSSLEMLDESVLPSSNVALFFLSFTKFFFWIFNFHTDSYLVLEVTMV